MACGCQDAENDTKIVEEVNKRKAAMNNLNNTATISYEILIEEGNLLDLVLKHEHKTIIKITRLPGFRWEFVFEIAQYE